MTTNSTLVIHQEQLGAHDNFIYVLADQTTGEAVVVDPAWDVPAIIALLEDHGYTLAAVWLTHGHGDHTNGVSALVDRYDVPVYLSGAMPAGWRPVFDAGERAAIIEFHDGDTLQVGGCAFRVLHTPGHSPDGSCFLHGNQLIAGDTLFIDGCGRCDLPDSDVNAMFDSIHGRLMLLPDDTVIYPGHDYGDRPCDTLANQKQSNRFMRAADRAAFVQERMG